MSSLPAQLGGPSIGRPVVDADEYARLSIAFAQMLSPGALRAGSSYKNLLGFYNSLLVGSAVHAGRSAMKICPTACVFFGRDGRLNMSFHPYYMDEIQNVRVKWPESEKEAEALTKGTDPFNIWLVKPSIDLLPSFIRASIGRAKIRELLLPKFQASPTFPQIQANLSAKGLVVDDLKTSDLMDLLEMTPEQKQEMWGSSLGALGFPLDKPVAVQVDNHKIIALCVHEIRHVAHLHLLVDRDQFPDPRMLNLAMDVAIDQFIDGVSDDQWTFHKNLFQLCGEPKLEENLSFDAYYRILKEFYERRGNKQTQTGSGQQIKIVMGPTPPGTPNAPNGVPPGAGTGTGAGAGAGAGTGIQVTQDQDGNLVVYVPGTPDDHMVWGQKGGDEAASGKPGGVDPGMVAAWLDSFRQKAKEKQEWGIGLGNLLRQIDEFLTPKVRWLPILKRFIGQYIRIGREATRKRPSRRLGWDAPGKRTLRSGKILFAIDNSGSISVDELKQFFGEISSLLNQFELNVVIWDTQIQGGQTIRNRQDLLRLAQQIGGGGGTDVHPVFRAIEDPGTVQQPELRRLFAGVDALVVLTDGDLLWPEPELDVVPTFWGITKQSNMEGPKFGLPVFVSLEKTP